MEISPIILAAGMSSRMGRENKLFLPFNGTSLLEATLGNILAAGLGPIIVVTGHESERVGELLKVKKVQIVENQNYKTGLTSSIQVGVRAAPPSSKGFMICLADMPLIAAETYQRLATEFYAQVAKDPKTIVLPVFKGKRGHPVVFSAFYKSAILALEHPDGCKPILMSHEEHVFSVEMTDNSVLQDADTPADFLELLKNPT